MYTFQALSEEDCELWLDAMDGKEPMYVHPPKPGNAHHTYLDEAGFTFIAKCFQALENRGKIIILYQCFRNLLAQFIHILNGKVNITFTIS